MSNVFDFKTNTSLPVKFNHTDILPELLYKEGLYNYIDIFLREEVIYFLFYIICMDYSDFFFFFYVYQIA